MVKDRNEGAGVDQIEQHRKTRNKRTQDGRCERYNSSLQQQGCENENEHKRDRRYSGRTTETKTNPPRISLKQSENTQTLFSFFYLVFMRLARISSFSMQSVPVFQASLLAVKPHSSTLKTMLQQGPPTPCQRV